MQEVRGFDFHRLHSAAGLSTGPATKMASAGDAAPAPLTTASGPGRSEVFLWGAQQTRRSERGAVFTYLPKRTSTPNARSVCNDCSMNASRSGVGHRSPGTGDVDRGAETDAPGYPTGLHRVVGPLLLWRRMG